MSKSPVLIEVSREDYRATLAETRPFVFDLVWTDGINRWSATFNTLAEAFEGLARLERNELVQGDSCEHDWRLTEDGYSRSWATEIENHDDGSRTIKAFYGGTEDWSETGDGQMVLECLQCGKQVEVDTDTSTRYIEYL